MRKLKWNRKLSILVLIMFITVTFASFNTNLFINGNAYVRADKDIRITNIHLLETEYNGYENTNSEYTNRTISTDVSLPRQASSLTYEVTISNVSDKRYKITDIIEDSYDNPDVKYELIDASIGNIIEPHTTKTFKVKFTNRVTVVEEDDVYQTLTYNFNYTGGEQTFTVPYDGEYTLEVWGAQGGTTYGGYGGYSVGKITLQKNKKLYINVGGQGGNVTTLSGGYNGGGAGSQGALKDDNTRYENGSGGGGATHIALNSGVLSKIEKYKDGVIIVAGGGGGTCGNHWSAYESGHAGGYIGSIGMYKDSNVSNGEPGGQTSSGNTIFGKGTNAVVKTIMSNGAEGNGGGGGGYYGGFSSTVNGTNSNASGPGGSGYIGYDNLTNKVMYCYQCSESDNTSTRTITTDNHSSAATSQYAKEGNGYAKITITRKIEDGSEYDYASTGTVQTFTAPYTGIYQLEVWGSQGATDYHGIGGYGGYARGNVSLTKGTQLNVVVGNYLTSYNGGGKNTSSGVRGGGATHIATSGGVLADFGNAETAKESVYIVAGGGGGSGDYNRAGSGGGFKGSAGQIQGNYVPDNNHSLGGTQTSGWSFGKGEDAWAQQTPAGGGGWYGGYAGGAGDGTSQAGTSVSAGGGSGYIGNPNLTDKIMYCYQCEESQDKDTRTVSTNSYSSIAKTNHAKEGNGYSRITLLKRTINQTKLTLDFTFEEYVNGNEYTFGYTGSEQTFTVPKTGYYKLETWGAEGSTYVNGIGGYGGHSFGTIKLIKGEKLYINVGGKSRDKPYNEEKVVEGGYNGGGSSGDSGGGGATHISTLSGILSELEDNKDSIIIVAGGGGGGERTAGGSGGGYIGNTGSYGYNNAHLSGATGGTQNAGGVGSVSNPEAAEHTQHGDGESGSFGQGANSCMSVTCGAGAGGGGYYGGGSSHYASGGGGGSGYIANGYLTDKAMYCYNCQESNEESIKTVSTTDVSSDPISNYAKSGDGFAKITLVEEIPEYTFDYTGDVQEFIAPYRGIYKVELWGAQGGNAKEDDENLGAYTSGLIELTKNKKLYLYVGSEGSISDYTHNSVCEFNGGGNATKYSSKETYFQGTGGGATDIRLESGNWDDFSSLLSRIMVAGAGGGTLKWGTSYRALGGPGGGLVGYQGNSIDTFQHLWGESGTGGTQISGGYAQCLKEGEGCDTWSDYSYGIHYGIGGFGYGGNPPQIGSAGGGAGYFGGGSSMHSQSGGSGSSYISGHIGCVSINENSTVDNISFVNDSNNISCNDENSVGYNSLGFNTDSLCSKHYSGYAFNETSMIDGAGYSWDSNGVGNTIVGMPTHDGRSTMIGNTGNGYAKITLLEKIDSYKISYNLDGGTLDNKRKTYSTFDDDITLGTPTKEGYIFTGWKGGTNLLEIRATTKTYNGVTFTVNADKSITMNGTATGDIFYCFDEDKVASGALTISDANKIHLKPNTYYYLNGKSYPSGSNPNYLLELYYQNNGSGKYPKGLFNTGSSVTDAYVYMKIKSGGVFENETIYPYLIELSYEDRVNYPSYGDPTIKGDYVTYDSTLNTNMVIPSGSKGNRTYTATWAKNYNIEYDLDGGTIAGQMTSYNKYTDTFNIPTPTKNGYTFVGWTGGKNLYTSEYNYDAATPITDYGTNFVSLKIIGLGSTYAYKKDNLECNKTYTISSINTMNYARYLVRIRLLDDSGWMDSSSGFSPSGWEYNQYYKGWWIEKNTLEPVNTITIPNGLYCQFGVGFRTIDSELNTSQTLNNIQIEEGNAKTSFETYISTPQSLTITKGSEGNRKYIANWKKM